MSSRRNFLKLVSAGTCGAVVHNVLSPAGSMMAFASPKIAGALGPKPFTVLVGLSGGISYNIAPVYAGIYRDKNPTVSYGPEESHDISPAQGLHPSLNGLHSVYQEGSLALVNMVGYPDPNRSHAESMDIWQSGYRTATGAHGGWAARLACQIAQSAFAGISLAGSNTLIQGDCNPPRALGDLDNLGENSYGWDAEGEWFKMARQAVINDGGTPASETHAFVRNSMLNLDLNLETLREHTESDPPIQFPNTGFGNRCRDAAKLLMASSSIDTRLVYIEQGGHDLHSNERPQLANLMSDLDGGLSALIQTAKSIGRWQDLLIVTFSEFSRTTWENGSQGTDHGHAVPVLIAGGAVRGGILTAAPTAAEIAAREYLRDYRIDFRQLFGEVVSAMRLNPSLVFPEGYSATGHIGILR